MARKEAEQPRLNLQNEPITSDVSSETTPSTAEELKLNKQSQKEPYKPFLIVADLGRSSCKTLIHFQGQSLSVDKCSDLQC